MRVCRLCAGPIPAAIYVNGHRQNLQGRKYCLSCSPYKAHNTKQLTKPLKEAQLKAPLPEADGANFRPYLQSLRRRRKAELIKRAGGRCQICGYNRDCLRAYDFHHVNPAEKAFGISGRGLLANWQELVEEAKKCVLLCCRCHAEVHDGLHGELEILEILDR